MVIMYATRHRLPVPRLARWLLALGIVATLAANMAQGWSHGPVGAAVAAWPAASPGSYELLVWIIRRARGYLSATRTAGSGIDIDAAAVAAYQASVRAGSPLSERRLAAMFGKTSRRLARNRLAEARQSPVPA